MQLIYDPRHEISKNVAFSHESTQTSLCNLLFSLETQNVRSVALQSQNIQATSKGSDQTARMRRLV